MPHKLGFTWQDDYACAAALRALTSAAARDWFITCYARTRRASQHSHRTKREHIWHGNGAIMRQKDRMSTQQARRQDA